MPRNPGARSRSDRLRSSRQSAKRHREQRAALLHKEDIPKGRTGANFVELPIYSKSGCLKANYSLYIAKIAFPSIVSSGYPICRIHTLNWGGCRICCCVLAVWEEIRNTTVVCIQYCHYEPPWPNCAHIKQLRSINCLITYHIANCLIKT